jgi:C-terminal region of eIF3h
MDSGLFLLSRNVAPSVQIVTEFIYGIRIKQAGLGFENMFEEVPIIVHNSNLVNSLLCEVEEAAPGENKYNFLDVGTK